MVVAVFQDHNLLSDHNVNSTHGRDVFTFVTVVLKIKTLAPHGNQTPVSCVAVPPTHCTCLQTDTYVHSYLLTNIIMK